MNFSLTNTEDGSQHLTVYVGGKLLPTISASHPNFTAIKEWCRDSLNGLPLKDDELEEFLELYDVETTIARKFERLTERVTVANGELLVDGDPAQPGLAKQVMRMLEEGEDVDPLVNFLEKIMSNPNEHSRTQAWDWLDNHDFTITEDGDVVGYKGVYEDGNGGYQSGSRGHAIRNGEEILNGYVPNAVGDVIEMPRSEVMHDPSSACSAGLHVGTYEYALHYAQGAMLRVLVNPRDIVSVPTDAGGEKIRVCRYTVNGIIDAPETKSVFKFEDFQAEDDDYAYEDYVG